MDNHMVRPVVSPHGDAPLYQQVAASLRAQITDGTIPAGAELRSEPDLCHDYGVGRPTIRRALAVLAAEGLVVIRRGYRTRVRSIPKPTPVPIPRGAVVTARMPTPEERRRWDLPAGVPVLVAGDGVWPADRYALVVVE